MRKLIRRFKILLILVAAFLLVAIIGATTFFGINLYVKASVKNNMYSHEEIAEIPEGDYDFILVLGAGIKKDGTPSDVLRDRLLTAISIYKSGACDKILMSGDNSR